jgi:hypothetical protein
MKLHTPTPELIRIKVVREGDKNIYMTIQEASLSEAYNFVHNLFKDYPYKPSEVNLKRTRVEVREYINKKNGKAKSLYLYGLSPEEIKNFITEKL